MSLTRLGRQQTPNSHSSTSSIPSTTTTNAPLTPDRYGFTSGVQYTPDDPSSRSNSNLSPSDIHKRELKWVYMFSHWDRFMRRDFETVKSRCRKGIPRSVRGRAWFYLCGAVYLQKQHPTLYSELELRDGPPEAVDDIRKDIHRQFPNHELFSSETTNGPNDLFQVLKCFSIYNGDEGYCQAHAPIAATLLMQMPAEEAFWCLVCICDKYVKNYYSPGMEALLLDGAILFKLLRHVSYPAYKLLKKQNIEPILYMTEWFLCLFTRTLPWPSVMRVWDMFLCEGVKVLFRVGLVLIRGALGSKVNRSKCTSMYDTLSVLKGLENINKLTEEGVLVRLIIKLDVSEELMRRVHLEELVLRKKKKEKEIKERQQAAAAAVQN